MFIRRSAFALVRRSATPLALPRRAFATSIAHAKDAPRTGNSVSTPVDSKRNIEKSFEEIKGEEDLLPEGAAPGTVPTDVEQATGLERLEILGKMQGIDIFDMKPLPADRLGTLDDPIMVKSAGEEQYCGCTGYPVDSHVVLWLTLSRKRPLGRCPECGSCYRMEYIGQPDDPHDDHHHHGPEEPKSFADYVKPEYYYR